MCCIHAYKHIKETKKRELFCIEDSNLAKPLLESLE